MSQKEIGNFNVQTTPEGLERLSSIISPYEGEIVPVLLTISGGYKNIGTITYEANDPSLKVSVSNSVENKK